MMMLCSIKMPKCLLKKLKDGIINAGNKLEMEVWVQRKEIFDNMHSI